MKKYIESAMTFAEYLALIDSLLAKGKTTGPNQSEALTGFTKLNRQRINRLEKTVTIDEATRAALNAVDKKQVWLIITELWCGDAAQNVPVIEKIAAESENVITRYILRDEYPELIDQFLTDGARSIPKLIAVDADTLEILFTWGSRPHVAQEYFLEMKRQGIEKAERDEKMQRWYNEDKGRSLQAEFIGLTAGQKDSVAANRATVASARV